jgi:hypothetical protein
MCSVKCLVLCSQELGFEIALMEVCVFVILQRNKQAQVEIFTCEKGICSVRDTLGTVYRFLCLAL